MLVALLVALGVDLIVIVAFAALLVGRRTWVKRQPGTFAGAIRISSGSWDGLGSSWKRGSGRLVRDVLVWHKAPFLFRTEVLPVDRLRETGSAPAPEVKRLGDVPRVVEVVSAGATFEVAVRAEQTTLLTERFARPA